MHAHEILYSELNGVCLKDATELRLCSTASELHDYPAEYMIKRTTGLNMLLKAYKIKSR